MPAGPRSARCATPPAGREDRSYAQPFERHHVQKHKWFSFAFNGQLANYQQLRERLLAESDNHLARDTDTEIIMHEIGRELSDEQPPPLVEIMRAIEPAVRRRVLPGAAQRAGRHARRPRSPGSQAAVLCARGPAVRRRQRERGAAEPGLSRRRASRSLLPGQAITITCGRFEIHRFAASPRQAHCFFEWIYFANVASTMDGRSVYLSRKALGRGVGPAGNVPIDEDTIVVPVPDTSKAAADAMAFKLKVPSLEGLIRNRYTGRTFIEGSGNRKRKAETKYTPLREVLEGKRVILVEDSIVRSTTMKVLLSRIRELGRAREIHVRVACPPIIAPVLLRHRHVDRSTSCSRRTSCTAAPLTSRPGRHGRHARRRFAPIFARRIDRAGHRLRQRPALPGLHHGPIPVAGGPGFVPNRAAKRRHARRRGPTRADRFRWRHSGRR